jgi:hypothetical protein
MKHGETTDMMDEDRRQHGMKKKMGEMPKKKRKGRKRLEKKKR